MTARWGSTDLFERTPGCFSRSTAGPWRLLRSSRPRRRSAASAHMAGAVPRRKRRWAANVDLDVLEEDVLRSKSIYCDQCRVVGWSDHPVRGKRHHFIIRNDKNSLSSAGVACIRCGTLLSCSNSRCLSCNCEISYDSNEGLAYLLFKDYTQLLHGIVHANGYGHLLRVYGRAALFIRQSPIRRQSTPFLDCSFPSSLLAPDPLGRSCRTPLSCIVASPTVGY